MSGECKITETKTAEIRQVAATFQIDKKILVVNGKGWIVHQSLFYVLAHIIHSVCIVSGLL